MCLLSYDYHVTITCLVQNRVTTVMETWKSVYETSNRHIPLVVKDPNTCARVVCADLYTTYGSHVCNHYRVRVAGYIDRHCKFDDFFQKKCD